MTLHARTSDEREYERPEGMLDYEVRSIIRDLVRVNGFEKAREKIAFYLQDEADRRRA